MMFGFKDVSMVRGLVAALFLLMTVALSGCSEKDIQFKGSDISGSGIGESWVLVDHNGQTVGPDRFEGKVKLVFFGFTQCPDICPTILAQISEALSLLGEDASDVQVLMMTVDPERDTPEILKAYLGAFDKGLPTRFLGMTGTADQVREAAGSFKAYYAKSPTPDGSYTMDHSTSLYLMDKDGKVRVLVSGNAGAQAIAQDIGTLLEQ